MHNYKFFIYVFVFVFICFGCDAFLPRSSESEKNDWWEHTVFYQIYPRSFMDSDGDGIGDIKGITSKLQHLKDTGIEATWLSPVFESPMVDFGYDISNFTSIHPGYGTMKDFEDMIAEAKKLEIKVILDFVPNHSSDQCEWFKKSINREKGYENYYIWHDGIPNPNGGKPLPPNNWVSIFYGPAWTWNEKRGQFFLHQFTAKQPDFNFYEETVVKEMTDVMRFWLKKGVDGFRVDAINHMFEDKELRNEPLSRKTEDPNSYDYVEHIYTRDLLANYDMIYQWRTFLDDWKKTYGGDTKIIMTEAYSNATFLMKYFKSDDGSKRGAHVPFNFLLLTDMYSQSSAYDIILTINKWLNHMPHGETANWVLGNHDQYRIGTRYGVERIDQINMILLTLPGIAITYYGEEIGMLDHDDISWEDTIDPRATQTNKDVYKIHSRDPERTPYQWDDTKNSGFSSATKTWLPINPNYKTLNLKAQKTAHRSHYKIYKQLVEIRRNNAFVRGSYRSFAFNKNVFAYIREISDVESFVIVINLSNTNDIVNLKIFETLKDILTVAVVGSSSNYKIGEELDTKRIVLGPYDSLVLKSTITNQNVLSNFTIKDFLYVSSVITVMVTTLWRQFSLNTNKY